MTIGYHTKMNAEATAGLPPALAGMAHDSIGGAAQAASQLDGPRAAGLMTSARSAFVAGASLSYYVAAGVGLVMAVIIYRWYPRGQTPVPSGSHAGQQPVVAD